MAWKGWSSPSSCPGVNSGVIRFLSITFIALFLNNVGLLIFLDQTHTSSCFSSSPLASPPQWHG